MTSAEATAKSEELLLAEATTSQEEETKEEEEEEEEVRAESGSNLDEEPAPKRQKTSVAAVLKAHRECFRVEVPWLSSNIDDDVQPRVELEQNKDKGCAASLDAMLEEEKAKGKAEADRDTLTVTVMSDPHNTHDLGVAALLWPASRLLAEVLLKPFVLGPEWVKLFDERKKTPLCILELGAGTALPSLCLAALGHRVFATDLVEALPVTQANVEANADLYSSVRTSPPVVRPLAFGDADAARSLPACDLVLASDVAYEPRSYYPLLDTLRSLPGSCWTALLAISQRTEDLGGETFENMCQDEAISLRLKYTALVGNVRPRRVNIYELKACNVKLEGREE